MNSILLYFTDLYIIAESLRMLGKLVKSPPNLLKKVGTYMMYGGMNAVLGFLLLPVLTRYLSPSDFGHVSIFTVSVMFISMLTRLEVQAALKRQYHQISDEAFKELLDSSFSLILLMFSGFTLFYALTYTAYLDFFGVPKEWFFAVLFLGLTGGVSTIVVSFLSIKDEASAVGKWQFISTLANYGLVLWFVVGLEFGWQGRIWPLIVVGLAQLVASAIIFRIKIGYRWRFGLNKCTSLLKYSLPLVPHSLGAYALMSMDRYFLSELLGMDATGIYATSAQISFALVLVYSSFMPTWEAWVFRNLGQDVRRHSKKAVWGILGFLSFFLILIFMFAEAAKIVLPLVLGKDFMEVSSYILLVSLVVFGRASYYLFTPLINLTEKTKVMSYTTVVVVLCNLIGNYYFINHMGIGGAAIATTVSYFIGTLVLVIYVEKNLRLFSISFGSRKG